jgi:glycogen operon protein
VDEVDERGQRVRDENFLLLMNAYHDELPFVLPAAASEAGWIALVDTSCQTTRRPDAFYEGGKSYPLQPRSLVLLVERAESQIRAEDRRYTAVA